jgi:hypothetical protein
MFLLVLKFGYLKTLQNENSIVHVMSVLIQNKDDCLMDLT